MTEKNTRVRPELPADAVAGATGHIVAHNMLIDAVEDLRTIQDGKAALVHSHTIDNVTGLQTALDTKAPTSHTHAQYLEPSEILAGANVTIDRNTTPGSVIISSTGGGSGGSTGSGGVTSHTELTNRDVADQHPITAITGLETALNGKATPASVTSAITAHKAEVDPHTQYLTQTEGDARYAEKAKVPQVLVVASLNDIPPNTPAGTVIVVPSSNAPAAPFVISYSEASNAAVTAMSLAKPANLADGDLLVLFLAGQNYLDMNVLATIPAGFTRNAWTAPIPPLQNLRYNDVAFKRVTSAAGEPATYSVAFPSTNGGRNIAILIAVRGVNATTPIAAYADPISQDVSLNHLPKLPGAVIPKDNCLGLGMLHAVCSVPADGQVSNTAGWNLVATRTQTPGSGANVLTILSKPLFAGTLAQTQMAFAGGTAASISSDAAALVVLQP